MVIFVKYIIYPFYFRNNILNISILTRSLITSSEAAATPLCVSKTATAVERSEMRHTWYAEFNTYI